MLIQLTNETGIRAKPQRIPMNVDSECNLGQIKAIVGFMPKGTRWMINGIFKDDSCVLKEGDTIVYFD